LIYTTVSTIESLEVSIGPLASPGINAFQEVKSNDPVTFLRASPKPPRSASPRLRQKPLFRSGTLCIFTFLEKNSTGLVELLHTSPGIAKDPAKTHFCEAEQRFLLLFLEEEEIP
jgi:hypothetical protein